MTSIFRKLTGRRKKTKPTTTSITQTHSGHSDIFTESSHASELDATKTTSSRPQHLLQPQQASIKEKKEPRQRSRSRSNDRASQRSSNIVTSGTAHSSNTGEKTGRSGTPQRNGRSGTPSRTVDHRDGGSWAANHGPSSSSGEGRYRKSRFSFSKPGSSSKIQASGSYDSEDETAATTSTATAPLKRGRKPQRQETATATPSANGAVDGFRTPETRVVRVLRKKQVPGDDTPASSSNDKKPPESAILSPPGSSRVGPTGKVISTKAISPEDHAKQLAQNKETERIARAAAALDNRGNEYFERGYYDKAMDAYTRALKLKRRTFHSMLEEADEIFDESAENEKLDSNESSDMDPKLLVSMATSINNIGYLRQRAGEATPDETMAAYKKSLKIKRKILGNDSLSVGKTLNNIGSVYYLKKEFEGALPAYEEALGIMQANLGEDHPDVATVISNMGDVCLAMKNQDESLARYRTALNIRWSAFGEKDPRTMRLLEKIARIEIGDKMPTPRGITNMDHQVYDWDESELYDLDLRPISHELRLLKEQVKEDVQTMELLEKTVAMGMVRDKLRIVRGMRELSEAQERGNASLGALFEGSFSYGEDSTRDGEDDLFIANTPQKSPVPIVTESRNDAQARVKERLNKLRLEKGLPLDGPLASSALAENSRTVNQKISAPKSADPEPSKFLRSALYSTGQQPNRTALSSLKPDEIKEQVDEIESALKLKKGIDNLRSFEEPKMSPEKSIDETATKDEAENPREQEILAEQAQVDTNSSVKDDAENAAEKRTVVEKPWVTSAEQADEFVDNQSEMLAAPKMMYATWLGEVED